MNQVHFKQAAWPNQQGPYWALYVSTQEDFLLALQEGEPVYHLGVFADQATIATMQARYLQEAKTCIQVRLDDQDVQAWLTQDAPAPAPVGHFGTAFSGYVIRTLTEDLQALEIFYTADLHQETLGADQAPIMWQRMYQHYDTRRLRCALC
ncbi:hypothetical protein SAMN05421831_104165 [Allopseudospirillum japonicum]|uniref:Uncharacterized protein n=1 Tax=Allopseudospirillum japonicum TaxID=64971 RepID=A0A1H6S1M0_9GAMM|nr:hypothetical protein [Allopseudospirillum japonicum]SEI57342.1 hypothetical protein SAMN05421831_104165 [Allopseudospirillum japonicum]